jgi:hypothetical protein
MVDKLACKYEEFAKAKFKFALAKAAFACVLAKMSVAPNEIVFAKAKAALACV